MTVVQHWIEHMLILREVSTAHIVNGLFPQTLGRTHAKVVSTCHQLTPAENTAAPHIVLGSLMSVHCSACGLTHLLDLLPSCHGFRQQCLANQVAGCPYEAISIA